MHSGYYQSLLQKHKNAAAARIQDDADRAAREKEEDAVAEESRLKALANLETRRHVHRQNMIAESLKAVQALKAKHAKEVAALQERHRLATISFKESIGVRERELDEHFDKQEESLDVAMTTAYDQRVEARKNAKAKLVERRMVEDSALRNEVFLAFEQEALAGAGQLHTPKASTSSPLCTPDSSIPYPTRVKHEEYESENVVCKQDESEDPNMLYSVARSELRDSASKLVAIPEAVRRPVKFQIAKAENSSKRQKLAPRPIRKLPAMSLPAPVLKSTFKLNSFSCGSATWHHSPSIFIRVGQQDRSFEIYHGKNSLSALHPDWVLDGKPGQSATFNTVANTFCLERQGSIGIWLEFKFTAELMAFIAQYKAFFEARVQITGS